jgi:hypothetical protein
VLSPWNRVSSSPKGNALLAARAVLPMLVSQAKATSHRQLEKRLPFLSVRNRRSTLMTMSHALFPDLKKNMQANMMSKI